MKLALVALAAITACTDGYDVRVSVTSTRLDWTVYDSACDSVDLLPPGSCYGHSEEPVPPSCKATTCVAHAQLELGGQVVGEYAYPAPQGANAYTVENPPAADELVLTGCMHEMRVPLPTTLPAAPTITSLAYTHVEWTTTPPIDRVTVDEGNGFLFYGCSVAPSTSALDLEDMDHSMNPVWVTVGAWAPVELSITSLGVAHVRAGATTSRIAN